jgi:hypothetical protein
LQVKSKDLIPAIIKLNMDGIKNVKTLKSFSINYQCKLLAEGAIQKKKVHIAVEDWRTSKTPLARDHVFVP